MSVYEPEVERPALDGGLLDTLAQQTGGSPAAIREAFDLALPAALYAIAELGSSARGSTAVFQQLSDGRLHELDTRALYRALTEPILRERTFAAARGDAQQLFAERRDLVEDAIAGATGLGHGAAATVLAFSSALALGLVGRLVRRTGLDERGLRQRLVDELPRLAAALPSPVRYSLGIAGPSYEDRLISRSVPSKEPPYWHHTWPWLVGVGTAVGLIFVMTFATRPRIFGNTQAPEANERPVVNPASVSSKPTPPTIAAGAPGQSSHSATVRQIANALDETVRLPLRFSLAEVFYQPRDVWPGSADLVAQDLAVVLSEHPAAKLRLEGRSGAGIPTQIADLRAEAFKDALVRRGVAADRIFVRASRSWFPPGEVGLLAVVLLSR